MGTLTVRRRGYALGAEVTGIDASQPLSDETFAELQEAIREHVVIYLPGQKIEPKHMRDFCGRFGKLDGQNIVHLQSFSDAPEVIMRANKPILFNGRETTKSATADQWHSDYSYSEYPTTLTFLLAKDIPDVGGDTMFANCCAAYEALSPAFQNTIDPLLAVYDVTLGVGFKMVGPEEQAKRRRLNPPVAHAAVRVHPETGRKALYVADRVRNFAGMTEEESIPIRDFLIRHATRYEFVYRHRWAVDDLVIWDNRIALHFAVQDYDLTQLRRMLRCSLVGPKTGRVYTEELEERSLRTATANS